MTATASPLVEQGVNSSAIGVSVVTVAGAASSTSWSVRTVLPFAAPAPLAVLGSAMIEPAVSTRDRSTSWMKDAT